ncbi:Asp23/Gls24 family envelope stress response protein [Corynebacterium hylobatis]|uniref:Asp23/Gls24 family envelope stress response protein n=1 Tax=Corynebacterium hylobatis TaxID=1859290 RepID=A0A3R9ZEC6_9CORY|nr:Asp23/Gls24 family envelope stress response protein [Corynebacterium hylobatis]RSZ64304.1 Asp23/Gls24 family envelope stress response protein [Corynebacterium hylobatis]
MSEKSEHNPGPAGPAAPRGITRIEDVVVGKIAALAAREVSGVHSLGGGTGRMVGALRESFAGPATGHHSVQHGVHVEVGGRQVVVDVSIVAEYGVAIHELAGAIRRNIISAIEKMTGMEVTEVNITVLDVHLDTGQEEEQDALHIEHTPRLH